MDFFSACYEELKRLYGLKSGQTKVITVGRSEERATMISQDEITKKNRILNTVIRWTFQNKSISLVLVAYS